MRTALLLPKSGMSCVQNFSTTKFGITDFEWKVFVASSLTRSSHPFWSRQMQKNAVKRHQESSVTKGVKKRKAIQGSLPYPAVTSMHIHPKYSKPCITRKEATTPSSTPTLVSISRMNIPQWFRKKPARSNMVKNMAGMHPSHHPSARRIWKNAWSKCHLLSL